MKINYYRFVTIAFAAIGLQATDVEMRSYKNEVTEIKEIAGVTNYTLALSCSQQNPIVSYVPESYQESQNNEIHRYFLPNTTLAEGIENETVSACQRGSHVEVLLFGKLVAQTAANHSAIFMVCGKS